MRLRYQFCLLKYDSNPLGYNSYNVENINFLGYKPLCHLILRCFTFIVFLSVKSLYGILFCFAVCFKHIYLSPQNVKKNIYKSFENRYINNKRSFNLFIIDIYSYSLLKHHNRKAAKNRCSGFLLNLIG